MKRIIAIVCACMLAVMMSVAPVFAAASLEITASTPKDGDKGMAVDNMGVKLTFNEDMYSKKYNRQQKACFKITDAKGKEVPIIVAINPNKGHQNEVLVLEDTTSNYKVKQETKYTLTISEDLVSAAGNTLSKSQLAKPTISFETMNQKSATTGNMLLMFVMMAAIILITVRDSKKQAEDEKTKKKNEQKVNPYKEAKKSGKSVEDVVAQDEKDKARRAEKQAAKDAKKAKQAEADRRLEEKERAKLEKEKQQARGVSGKKKEYVDPSRKRVSKPMPISAAGSTYKTGRKALAEAEAAKKAAEEAARKAKGTTNPKKKGKKGKKKK